MTPFNLRTLLRLLEAELDRLRLAHEDIVTREADRDRDPLVVDLAAALAEREAGSLDALRGYLERHAFDPVLDIHAQLDWDFPLLGTASIPARPNVADLIDIAEESDALLDSLSQDVGARAVASSEFDALLASVEAILASRQAQLRAAMDGLAHGGGEARVEGEVLDPLADVVLSSGRVA